jgi:hypothetical protein
MRHHSIASSAITLSLLAFGLSACGGGGDSPAAVVCPAVVDEDEPSLILASAQSAATSASVPVVVLSDIVVSGVPLPPELLPRQALNVRPVGNNLECTLPCGFTTASGEIVFTVSAAGYAARRVTATGSYASRYGSCPVTQTGGNRIAVALQPV